MNEYLPWIVGGLILFVLYRRGALDGLLNPPKPAPPQPPAPQTIVVQHPPAAPMQAAVLPSSDPQQPGQHLNVTTPIVVQAGQATIREQQP